MNKIFIIVLMTIVLSSFALGNVALSDNETLNVETECFTAYCKLSESAYANLTVKQGTTLIYQVVNNGLINDTEWSYEVCDLNGNTAYTWIMSGRDATNRSQAWTSGIHTVTTDQYQITGAVRTLINLFVFVLIALSSIAVFVNGLNTGRSIKEMVAIVASIILGGLILSGIISAVLKL